MCKAPRLQTDEKRVLNPHSVNVGLVDRRYLIGHLAVPCGEGRRVGLHHHKLLNYAPTCQDYYLRNLP
jgi:hypothetical protein